MDRINAQGQQMHLLYNLPAGSFNDIISISTTGVAIMLFRLRSDPQEQTDEGLVMPMMYLPTLKGNRITSHTIPPAGNWTDRSHDTFTFRHPQAALPSTFVFLCVRVPMIIPVLSFSLAS